ncbi:hypothetical protein [Georgenia daeguensis]|uniref:AMP-binding enzyme C-terminal domain-containing protein n=1 Tax=Georgenia daeguensis TaxID=908355 RepID=A0ABP8EXI4_9MICO
MHPNVFHDVLDGLPLTGWQVVQEADGLRVLLTAGPRLSTSGVEDRLVERLRSAGARRTRVRVEVVGAIPRTPLGKSPLVRARPPDGS